MQNSFKVSSFQLFLILGIVSLNLLLTRAYPSEVSWMPDGFATPIVAFEFLETETEVQKFLGIDLTKRSQIKEALLDGNFLDNFYILFFCSFLISWLSLLYQNQSKKLFFVFSSLCVVIALSDFFENMQMDAIIHSATSNMDFSEMMSRLQIFTWIKWAFLSIVLGIISLRLKKNYFFKTISILTFLFALFGIYERSVLTSYFTKGIMIQFVILIAITLTHYTRQKKSYTSI